MSREDGRRAACEAEGPEGTGVTVAQGEDPEERSRRACQPPAVGSIRLLYGDAVPVLVRTSWLILSLPIYGSTISLKLVIIT